MELFEILKQLKKIEPDPAFKETSKRAVFALNSSPARPGRVRATLLKILETGVAVALTGFFVLLLTGAFSGTGIAPQYAAVNPDALRAEAQAIDIQIQLANLNYATAPAVQSTASTPAVATAESTTPIMESIVSTTTVSSTPAAAASSSTSTATTTTITIDQALQGLAQ